ncbi:MAG TPA: hypothetical protein VM598_10895, partial [Bdellovibrionota bacterium]|nr:hypothetical protein [Bdellovibrionota bacterium]
MAIPFKRPHWTIGTKLVSLIAVLLLSSIAGVGLISTDRMVNNAQDLVRDFTRTSASMLAAQVRESVVSTTDKMRILGGMMVQDSIRPDTRKRIASELFASDPDFLAIYVHALDESGAARLVTSAVSPELARLGDPTGMTAWKNATEDKKGFQLDQLGRGEAQ